MDSRALCNTGATLASNRIPDSRISRITPSHSLEAQLADHALVYKRDKHVSFLSLILSNGKSSHVIVGLWSYEEPAGALEAF
jgi:hypothetical protein